MEVSGDEVLSAAQQRQQALSVLDNAWGALSIGETKVSRVVLDRMGAELGGAPLALERLNVRQVDQSLIDQVVFCVPDLKAYLETADADHSGSLSDVLFELASLRASWAPALLSGGEPSNVTINRLHRLLQSVQSINLNDTSAVQSLPGWVDKIRSGGFYSLSTGLQLYGFYSSIRGITEAIRTGNTRELLFEGGAFTLDVLSLGVELALERAGTKMMHVAHSAFRGFSASRAGLLLCRGAGLMASVLTLPFDIAQAVIALSEATKSEGKVAQDLYVEAGFSLASATLGLALGAAALAGFGAAGPVGLVASAVLIIGARAYSAGRVVDEIDDYIELSTLERLRTGWFSFVGMDLDEGVFDRYTISRTRSLHEQELKARAEKLLDGELKQGMQAIVHGKFEVRLQTVRRWKHVWNEGETPYVDARVPVIKDVDDYFDARKDGAIDALPEASWGTKGPEKGVVWMLGGGADTVMGLPVSPNHFRFSGGMKYLLGGSADDEYVFDVPRDTFSATQGRVQESILIGSTGADTLNLAGGAEHWDKAGFNVNLGAGTVHLMCDNPYRNAHKCMSLWGIENTSTLPGAFNTVTGSNEANRIVMQGAHDTVDAMAGDDQLLILAGSARVKGGPGADYYEIGEHAQDVVIEEDGKQASLVLLNWPFSGIQRWWIEGTALKVASVVGRDGETPGPSVTVENVYTLQQGKRHRVNNLFSFLTRDGYRLTPLLFDELDANAGGEVNVRVIAPRGTPVSPLILGVEQSVALAAGPHDYFLDRGVGLSVIDASASTDTTRCCLYVDYDSRELSGVYAYYQVATRRQSQFDYLDYTAAEINFVFGDGRRLRLSEYAVQPSASWTSVGGALQASAFRLRGECIVVMRDGVSYRLMPPTQSYVSDHADPGHKRVDGSASLHLRYGRYAFFTPRWAKSIHLTQQSQRVVLREPPHPAAYRFEGQGGVYEIELRSWAHIELLTPGVLDKTCDASTWVICCSGLEEEVDLDNIRVGKGSLRIGSVSLNIHPPVDPDTPLERIRIRSRQGVHYEVRLDIEKVFVDGVVVPAGRSVNEVISALRHARQRSSVFKPVVNVPGLRLHDGTVGAVYYDVVNDRWVLEADRTRDVSSEQLVIS